MDIIVPVLLSLLYILLGGFFIMSAVEYFNSKKYFRFGLDVMFAIIYITNLVELILKT
jgi:hypothetical protein